jgi:homocysteine S-methyltransferase
VTEPEASLRDELRHQVLLLDGGLSTTLELHGHDISGDLWSARLLADEPDAIVQAHRAFFNAGAEVATTATYQATFEGFAAHGIEPAETAALMRRGVALAQSAAAEVDRPTWVAASVGPYGAMLAAGSEYHGRYGLSVTQLREFHRPRIAVLAEAGADVLALETIPCAAEVEALLLEIDGSGLDSWLSVSIAGSTTRAGESLNDVFAMTRDVDELIAVGINCSSPSDATAAVVAAAATGSAVVIYPNSGEGWDAERRVWTPRDTTNDTTGDTGTEWPLQRWIADGARLIGGCCRVTPDDIVAMSRHLATH